MSLLRTLLTCLFNHVRFLLIQTDNLHVLFILACTTYICAKDHYEAKYQYLINKSEKVGLKHDDIKTFVEYSSDMRDAYKNIEEYSLGKKHNSVF